ncbi:MAG: ABC transporter ATP-binding protein [Firmicutes bacterium]|nr:ABC transporter ATP-binding protein [Bacillota bacterium]
MSCVIDVKDLHFKYYNQEILNNINIKVEKGSFVSILGPNGSGKTTLLKNICNFLKPNNGTICIKDKEVFKYKNKELAKNVAVVHQNNDVNFDFSIYDIVLMGRLPYQKKFKSESKKDHEIVKKNMKKTEIWKFKDKSIHEISGGERQRVMIARALSQQPDILLLDEPISALDIKHQMSILSLCKDLVKDKDISIITTLHDINLAARFSDLIILLDSGEIKSFDIPKKVLTAENIESVYGVKVDLYLKDKNIPYIIPKAI